MSDLRLAGIAKRFGQVEALRGVDFQVAAGEFFCLLGPSAAGKTTTLRTIAGLEEPDAGQVFFAGEDITARPARERGLAMIFQTFALYPHLTTFDNLAYPLREAKTATAEINRRVNQIAEMLRISHALARKPATLSGGEQQRLRFCGSPIDPYPPDASGRAPPSPAVRERSICGAPIPDP